MSEYPKIETYYVRDEKTHGVTEEVRCPEFELIDRWLVTEKIDGTNVRIEFARQTLQTVVEIKGRTANAQMPTFLYAYLTATFTPEIIAKAFDEDATGTLYGEGYGPKIQKGGIYRSDGPSFRLFDVKVGDWWLNWPDVEDVAAKLGIKTVPVLGRWSTAQAVRAARSLASVVAEEEAENPGIAEGLVCRTNPLLFNRKGERVMWKLKERDFK